jgi:hypothetical protein
MCVFSPDPCLFDLKNVLARLSDSDQARVMSEELRAACMQTFAKFVAADGSICEEDLADAVMAAVPVERQQTLGITAETARSLLGKLGLSDNVSEDEYLHLWRWAETEKTLELCGGPIVALVLPHGMARFGIESIEHAIGRLDTLADLGTPMSAGDLVLVQKMWEKCVPFFNPSGFKTCQTMAMKALQPLVYLAKKNPLKRAPLLEAVARISAGHLENACYAGRMKALREVLALALQKGQPATDSQMALAVCCSLAPYDEAALSDLIADIAEHATAENPGTFACVQASALNVLSQLSAHEKLQPLVAGVLPLPILIRMNRDHRALETNYDRFDFQLLCLNLLPYRTDEGVQDVLLDDLIVQGALSCLVEALAASVQNAEWPIGSNCFRRPVPLLNVLRRVCLAGKASWCRDAYRSVGALLEDEPRAALDALRQLATSRRNSEVIAADAELMAKIQEIIDESKAFDDGSLAEVGEALQCELAAQATGVYDLADFDELCGGKRVVHLRGTVAESGYTLHCGEYDRVLDLLLDAEVIVWDHDGAPEMGPTTRPEDQVNFSTSYTQILIRALREAGARAWSARARGESVSDLVVAGFLSGDETIWRELVSEFPAQVLFFAKPISTLQEVALPPLSLSRGVSGVSGTERQSYVTHDESTAIPPEECSAFSVDVDYHPIALQSLAGRVSHARTVVSLGLSGASKDDFALLANGDCAGAEEWYVFPTSQIHPTGLDLSLDEWGGLALREPVVFTAATRRITALSGEWKMSFNASANDWEITAVEPSA